MKAFWAFDKEAFKDGAVDVLHKQLVAVAVALIKKSFHHRVGFIRLVWRKCV
jgi:hypothetical protein